MRNQQRLSKKTEFAVFIIAIGLSLLDAYLTRNARRGQIAVPAEPWDMRKKQEEETGNGPSDDDLEAMKFSWSLEEPEAYDYRIEGTVVDHQGKFMLMYETGSGNRHYFVSDRFANHVLQLGETVSIYLTGKDKEEGEKQ